jgi:ElaB/YqjD/DUF883 family membrane-anchored ribosome-binding protein
MNTYEQEADIQDTAEDIKTSAQAKASELAEGVKQQIDIGKEKMTEANQKAVQYIKDHPWTSLSLSLGVGVLLGFLCRR